MSSYLEEQDDFVWFTQTTTGICILDPNWKVVTVNSVVEELFGLKRSDVIDQKGYALPHVPSECQFQLKRYFKHVQTYNQPVSYRTIRRR